MSTYKDVDQLKLNYLVQINLCEQGKKMAEPDSILYHQLDAAIGAYNAVIQDIDAQPMANVKEVKCGKWEFKSIGGHKATTCTACQHADWDFEPNGCMHFCPYCGAEITEWVYEGDNHE